MTPVDKCHAAYVQCLGSHPTSLKQIECTFKYAQCVMGVAQALATKQLKSDAKKAKAKK